MEKQLGIKRYELVWCIFHKLRQVMGNRYATCTGEEMIEFEEGYFTIEFTEIEQEKGIRRRSDVGKFNVAIMG